MTNYQPPEDILQVVFQALMQHAYIRERVPP